MEQQTMTEHGNGCSGTPLLFPSSDGSVEGSSCGSSTGKRKSVSCVGSPKILSHGQGDDYHYPWDEHQDGILIRLYAKQPLPADRLGYTAEFEGIYHRFLFETGLMVSRHHVFCRLLHLRKDVRGLLDKKGKKRVTPMFWW